MNDSPVKINEWLNLNINNLLTIKKEEDGDIDLAELKLEKIDLVQQKGHENYLSPQALLLSGKGSVITDIGKAPLPYDVFEIPLTDQWSAEIENSTLHLSTERGIYVIEVRS